MSYAHVEWNDQDLEFEIQPLSYSEDHEYGSVDYYFDYDIGEILLDGSLIPKEDREKFLEIHDDLIGNDSFDEQCREICRDKIISDYETDWS